MEYKIIRDKLYNDFPSVYIKEINNALHLWTFKTPILTALKNKKCNGEFHTLPYLSS